MHLDFSQTPSSFVKKKNSELRTSILMFKAMNYPWLISFGKHFLNLFLWFYPVKYVVKRTIFKQFCGGETIEETQQVQDSLLKENIHSILDYSIEHVTDEKAITEAHLSIMGLIDYSQKREAISFACVKLTGIAPSHLLEAISTGTNILPTDKKDFETLEARLTTLCENAISKGKRLLIDAEESWVQVAIDVLSEKMMAKFNKEEVWVYTTIQCYTTYSNKYTKALLSQKEYKLGVKLVRGAYHEQERERASLMNYPSPILENKQLVDDNYNATLKLLFDNIDRVAIMCSTHNPKSLQIASDLMESKGLALKDKSLDFAQLYGMGDHLSYPLAQRGYNVSKYIPYGPVKETIPYLIRRAQENRGAREQMGVELSFLLNEKRSRNTDQKKLLH